MLEKIKIKSTRFYDKWFIALRDKSLKRKILARLGLVKHGYFGDFKSVGDGVFELRIMSHGGIRIYYTFKNNIFVLLLCGGDKSTQKKDIEKAKTIKKDERL